MLDSYDVVLPDCKFVPYLLAKNDRAHAYLKGTEFEDVCLHRFLFAHVTLERSQTGCIMVEVGWKRPSLQRIHQISLGYL